MPTDQQEGKAYFPNTLKNEESVVAVAIWHMLWLGAGSAWST